MRLLASILGMMTAVFLPEVVHAQVGALPGIVDYVIGGTPLTTNYALPQLSCPGTAGVGACMLSQLFLYAVQRARVLIGAIAFLVIVFAAFRLIVYQAEESITTARKTIVGVVIGVVVISLAEQFVDALYGGITIPAGEVLSDPSNLEEGVFIISNELLGILRWGETLVAITAVGLIVVQGIIVLSSFGSEEAIRKAYRAVFSTVIGILLIVFDRAIAALFGYDQLVALPNAPNATTFIMEVFGLVRLVLGFVGIVAVSIVVYAGYLMIVHYGNDDLITKARTILINAAIGLALIATSFVIVHTVILGAV